MKLDDLARRAADEVKEAGRAARFTVRAPGSWRWGRPAVAFAAAGVALAVGLPLMFLKGPWRSTVLEPSTTTSTTQAPTTTTTSTTAPTTTSLAPGKTPAPSVEELVTGIFAALTAEDAEALHGLFADGTWHRIYAAQGSAGVLGGIVNHTTYQPEGEAWEVLGDVIVAGEVAVAPVRATYAEIHDIAGAWVGFDVMVVEEVAGGFLGGMGITLYAEVNAPGYAEADPAVVEEILAAQAAAWAAGDIAGVLAGYVSTSQPVYITLAHGGTASRSYSNLADLLAGMRLEFTGEPVISGSFVAVATRVTDLASGVSADEFSIYWIEDGMIQLHVLTRGA